ncbi:MAG: hypothetical protein V2I33_18765 [Kangiellaceae bacterium]|jgi:hypothetical protein|nr:hypothetical protein [Kangiellaceae bacterium]
MNLKRRYYYEKSKLRKKRKLSAENADSGRLPEEDVVSIAHDISNAIPSNVSQPGTSQSSQYTNHQPQRMVNFASLHNECKYDDWHDEGRFLFDSDSDEEDGDKHDPRSIILDWYSRQSNVPKSAVNDLLRSLKPLMPCLPKQIDTLLRPMRADKSDVHSDSDDAGKYLYFGVLKTLERQIPLEYLQQSVVASLFMILNVDGIQLAKTGSNSAWTVLLKIPCLSRTPMLVAFYVGKSKPKPEKLLSLLVKELQPIMERMTFEIHGVKFRLDRVIFVCDAPARAFLKGCKGHSGYHSCERCCIEGRSEGHVLVFDEDCQHERTNESFRERDDVDHHVTDSVLERLPIDMVKDFILDSMHLVLLGVTRRLFLFWRSNGPLPCRLTGSMQAEIDNNFVRLHDCMSILLSRKPRPLAEMGKFKATEFRTVLKFTGVVAFRPILNANVYKNFLLLHSAFTILSGPLCIRYNRLARAFLSEFLRNSRIQYSSRFFSYNIHSLGHLWQDVLHHKLPLSAIDCFPFENFFVQLKSAIKSPYLPAEQVANRVQEGYFAISLERDEADLTICFQRTPAYLPRHLWHKTIYHKFSMGDFILHTSRKDCLFADKAGKIHQFLGVVQLEEPVFVTMPLRNSELQDLYNYPCKSSILGIYKYYGIFAEGDQLPFGQSLQYLKVSGIGCKYICLPSCCDTGYCLFPMTVAISTCCNHCSGV